MDPNMYDKINIDILPNELFIQIFSYLPVKTLMKCRLVSVKWMYLVGRMVANERYWRMRCDFEFEKISKDIKKTCMSDMTWFEIYRSLRLWPKIASAEEIREEFCHVPISNPQEDIVNMSVLRDGVVGVHKRNGITYFNIETLKPLERKPLTGEFLQYAENDHYIVLLSTKKQMQVLRKVHDKIDHEITIAVGNVKKFLLLEQAVFFHDKRRDVFMCKFTTGNLEKKFLGHVNEKIIAMGYTNTFHVLLFERNLFSLVGGRLKFIEQLGSTNNLVNEIHNYGLLQTVNWNLVFQWMYDLQHKIPTSPIHDISTMRIYGPMAFIGTSWGVVRIIIKPYQYGEFDVFQAAPLWHYNFLNTSEYEQISNFTVRAINITEKKNGHNITVATPKKIIVIKYKHKMIPLSGVPSPSAAGFLTD